MQKYKDEGLYQPIYQRYEQLIKQKQEKYENLILEK